MGVERFFSNMEIGKRKVQTPTTVDLYTKKRAQEKCRKVYKMIVSRLTK